MTASTFNEAHRLLGIAPLQGRFDSVFETLKLADAGDPVACLAECLELAKQIEKQCHTETIETSVDMLLDHGIERERLQAYFHQVAQYGEARMLARVLATAHQVSFLARHTEGEA